MRSSDPSLMSPSKVNIKVDQENWLWSIHDRGNTDLCVRVEVLMIMILTMANVQIKRAHSYTDRAGIWSFVGTGPTKGRQVA